MGNLIPNEVIIYERVDDVVYARYRDPPYDKIPRWKAGGTPQIDPTFEEWIYLNKLSKENETLRKQLDRLMILYYTIKDSSQEEQQK